MRTPSELADILATSPPSTMGCDRPDCVRCETIATLREYGARERRAEQRDNGSDRA